MRRKIFVVFILFCAIITLGKGPYRFPKLFFFPPPPNVSGMTKNGVALGRKLFYDPILSRDSSISCSHCHQQEFAFTDSGKKFSSGIQGKNLHRNTMALFNLAWFPSYFTDGRAATLKALIRFPIHDEMEMNSNWDIILSRLRSSKMYRREFRKAYGQQKIDSNLVSDCVAQFLLTLLSNQSKYDSVIQGLAKFDSLEQDGFRLFNDQTKGGCMHCHVADGSGLGTTLQFSNNGLDSVFQWSDYTDPGRGGFTQRESDYGKFMIPSVRNLKFTAPYMHDGRFKTLNDVLDFYSDHVHVSANVDSRMEFAHQGGNHLNQKEKESLIAFLNTMNDDRFIRNKAFSNPFLKRRNSLMCKKPR